MADKIKNIKGSLILLLAAFIWGTAFVAQTSGADSVGTFTFNTCRSVVGALFLLLVIVLLDSYGKRTAGGGKDTIQELYSRTKWPVKGGVLCGIILFVAMSYSSMESVFIRQAWQLPAGQAFLRQRMWCWLPSVPYGWEKSCIR